MDKSKAKRLLVQLAEHGVPPQELLAAGEALPMFSVGVDAWIDRLARAYLQELSRDSAHFKLVVAPYGGGKTHFLMALAVRCLAENFAVSYLQCVPDRKGAPVRIDNPLGLYAEAVGRMRINGQDGEGVSTLLEAVVERKRREIEAAGASDADAAFSMYLRHLKKTFNSGVYGDFAHVLSEALGRYWTGGEPSSTGQAAEKWLEGRMDSLTSDEFRALGLRRVMRNKEGDLGRKLMLAMSRFTKESGSQGWALLIDEVETLFTVKGKALQAVLGAIRVMVDWTGFGGAEVPLFCVFAATPDVLDAITRYPALQQRLAVAGATFEEGHDYSPQIRLDRLQVGHTSLLEQIGERLVGVAIAAADGQLTQSAQATNSKRLAKVASSQTLDVDARRLFVKTWAGLLLTQMTQGERAYEEEELVRRYRGDFQDIQRADEEALEP